MAGLEEETMGAPPPRNKGPIKQILVNQVIYIIKLYNGGVE